MSRSMQFRFVVLAVTTIFLGGSAFADNFVVDDDSAECPAATHATIQGAVNAAAATIGKDKIDICPGTYVENVVIGAGNEVDIKGDGPGSARPLSIRPPGRQDPLSWPPMRARSRSRN